MIRLSKYLSLCGVTSRRGAQKLVEEGRVTINDHTVEEIGTIVDEEKDVVKVDGTEVTPVTEKVYVVLNKPRHVMTTLHDPFRRKTVLYYLKTLPQRVYPVGRLDFDTEGVIILCNDGDLTYRLAHPRYNVKKIYEATVSGIFRRADAMRIRRGIRLEDGAIGRAEVEVIRYKKGNTRIRLTMNEGRKREIKQLCKAVGHPVKSLRRVEFGGISVQGLLPGKWRFLTEKEVAHLKGLVGLDNLSA